MAEEDRKILEELGHGINAYGFSSLQAYSDHVRPGYRENVGQSIMTEIITDEKYVGMLLQKQFWCANFTGSPRFPVTASDRGVTVIGTGLDDPDVMLILPLAPHAVLYLTTPERYAQLTSLSIDDVLHATVQSVIQNARQFVFGTEQTDRQHIERHLPFPSPGAPQS
jgi:hypothetical protein